MQRGEVVGTLAPALRFGASAGVPSAELRTGPSIALRAGFGRNGAGNPRNCTRAGSTLLKILSPSKLAITEPTGGRAG